MRNLKRALSLTLASVMLLGMMVVGSSAVGYSDVTEEENIEAIEVLQTVGVMEGVDEENFNPDGYVTREQMAVIMSKLLNLDYNYYEGTNPFSDVPSWAAKYVAACAANGITSGIGGGMYGAGQNVNAVQAALMMLKALGYFQYQADFGDSYILATVKQATEVGLFAGIDSNAQSALTRNEVAQMALNALQSDMVTFTGDVGTKIPTAQGDVVVGYKAEYTPRTSTLSKYQAIERRSSDVGGTNNLNRGQYYIQLGEELYNGDLVLHEYSDDDFMRPSRNWEYKGKDIGTYMKKENIRAEYTGGVSRRTLYDLLGKTNLVEYDFNYYVDGVAFTNITAEDILTRSTKNYGTTGRGVLTQVFVDIEAETIDITSINTYLAQAASDYSKSTEKTTLNVYYNYNSTTKQSEYDAKPVALADVDNIEDIKQDDFRLVNVSGKYNSKATEASHNKLQYYNVVIVSDVEILTDSAITKFSKKSASDDPDSDKPTHENVFSSVTSGGTAYDGAKYAVYSDEVLDLYANDRLVNKTYNIYLDPYGNAIGVDLYAGDDNYVFITGVDLDSSNISMGTAKAAAIFPDGTMKTITVDVRATNKNIAKVDAISEGTGDTADVDSYFEKWTSGAKDGITGKEYMINRWYTYSMDSNNEYTLNPATRMIVTSIVDDPDTTTDDTIIKCNNVRIDELVSKAGDTTYVKDPAAAASNDGKNRYAVGRESTRVYGNDNSIYLVVEAEETVSTSGGKNVISDVTGVYTGVQNVEIKVAGPAAKDGLIDDTALYDSIYTVYDKNNYVIASVVLGEVVGGNANYVYTLTAATSEELLSDGTHVWTFNAIVDGTKQTLTARSKFSSTINDLEPGHVQELRYDGDYVVGVSTPTDGNKYYTDPTAKIGDEVIYDVGHKYLDKSAPDCPLNGDHSWIDNADEVRIDPNNANELRAVGRTMYLGRGYDQGLALVSETAPAVVIQKEDGDWTLSEHVGVAAAIGAMGDADETTSGTKNFAGRIVAVLDDQGRAKWVVFISDTPVNSATGSVPANGDDKIEIDPAKNTVKVTTVNTPDGIMDIAARIRKEMERKGYTDIDIEINTDNEIVKVFGIYNGNKCTLKQLGAIEILTDAQLAENAGNRVTALPKNIDLDADDMIGDDEAAAKAAAKAAVKQAVETGRAAGDPAPAEPDTVKTTNGFTLTFTWGAYTPPTTSDAGSIVISSLAIKKGAETATLTDVTFAIAKLTDEEQAEIDAAEEAVANQTAVNTSKTEIEKLTLSPVANASLTGVDEAAKKAQIVQAVKTAIEAAYEEGVEGTITVSAYTAAVNGVAEDNGANPPVAAVEAKDGSFTVSIALSKGEATATATLDGTITATPAA